MVIARNLVTHGEILRDQRRRLGRLARSYVHAVGLFVEAYLDLDAEEYVKLAASPAPAKRGEPRESWLEGYCMDPSKACAALHDTAASVHMSGTLRPLEEYRASIASRCRPSPFSSPKRMRARYVECGSAPCASAMHVRASFRRAASPRPVAQRF